MSVDVNLNIKLSVVEREGCVQLDHQMHEAVLVYLMDGKTTKLTWKPGVKHVK